MEPAYYILKKLPTETNVWIIRLDENDPIISYPTKEEAYNSLGSLVDQYGYVSPIIQYIENPSEAYRYVVATY